MTASALNMQLREGVRRLFGNDWLIVVLLALIKRLLEMRERDFVIDATELSPRAVRVRPWLLPDNDPCDLA